MILKWLNSNKNIELLFLDSVSKFVLVGKSIVANDSVATNKAISTAIFKDEQSAARVFDEIIKRFNTDESDELVFDVPEFLDNFGISDKDNDDNDW